LKGVWVSLHALGMSNSRTKNFAAPRLLNINNQRAPHGHHSTATLPLLPKYGRCADATPVETRYHAAPAGQLSANCSPGATIRDEHSAQISSFCRHSNVTARARTRISLFYLSLRLEFLLPCTDARKFRSGARWLLRLWG